jgi:hypothetical protein
MAAKAAAAKTQSGGRVGDLEIINIWGRPGDWAGPIRMADLLLEQKENVASHGGPGRRRARSKATTQLVPGLLGLSGSSDLLALLGRAGQQLDAGRCPACAHAECPGRVSILGSGVVQGRGPGASPASVYPAAVRSSP